MMREYFVSFRCLRKRLPAVRSAVRVGDAGDAGTRRCAPVQV